MDSYGERSDLRTRQRFHELRLEFISYKLKVLLLSRCHYNKMTCENIYVRAVK